MSRRRAKKSTQAQIIADATKRLRGTPDVRPSLQVTASVNGDVRPALLDPADPHQAPNLAFFDFQSYPREVWHASFVKMYGLPPKKPFGIGEDLIELNISTGVIGAGGPQMMKVDRKEYVKRLEQFVTVWLDRYIATGKLEVMPDGNLRRKLAPTMVHVAEPAAELWYCEKCKKSVAYICEHRPVTEDALRALDDTTKDGIPHAEWIADTEAQEELRERWRKAKPADLTVGQLEELMKQSRSNAA